MRANPDDRSATRCATARSRAAGCRDDPRASARSSVTSRAATRYLCIRVLAVPVAFRSPSHEAPDAACFALIVIAVAVGAMSRRSHGQQDRGDRAGPSTVAGAGPVPPIPLDVAGPHAARRTDGGVRDAERRRRGGARRRHDRDRERRISRRRGGVDRESPAHRRRRPAAAHPRGRQATRRARALWVVRGDDVDDRERRAVGRARARQATARRSASKAATSCCATATCTTTRTAC